MTAKVLRKAQISFSVIKCALAQHFPECILRRVSFPKLSVNKCVGGQIKFRKSRSRVYWLRAPAGHGFDQFLTLAITGWDNLLKLPMPQFPCLYNGNNII